MRIFVCAVFFACFGFNTDPLKGQYGSVEYVVFFVDVVLDLKRFHQRYDFCMNGVSDLSRIVIPYVIGD